MNLQHFLHLTYHFFTTPFLPLLKMNSLSSSNSLLQLKGPRKDSSAGRNQSKRSLKPPSQAVTPEKRKKTPLGTKKGVLDSPPEPKDVFLETPWQISESLDKIEALFEGPTLDDSVQFLFDFKLSEC